MSLLLTIIAALASVSATDFDPYEGPKPLLVFIQTDPWRMVIGSDTPRVAVYENGHCIFVKRVDDRLEYHHVTLTQDQLADVTERIKPLSATQGLKPRYDVRPNATDQPEAKFYLRSTEQEIATSVYGLMAPGTRLPAYTEFPDGPEATIPPKELLDLHKWLCEFQLPHSQKWRPTYVEVMLWDYSYAPDESVRWPADWPGLNSERAKKRGDDYSIYLDGDLLPKVEELLRSLKPRGALEIEGNKMAISYRYVFSSEPTWRKAFAARRD